MKCPWCEEWEGTPEEYPEHLKECPSYRVRGPFGMPPPRVEASIEISSVMLKRAEELGISMPFIGFRPIGSRTIFFRMPSGEEARKKMKELEGKGIKAKWWIEPIAPEWFGAPHSSSPKHVRVISVWKGKVADAIAKMVVYRGRFEKRDADELAETIQRMLDKYEKEWG